MQARVHTDQLERTRTHIRAHPHTLVRLTLCAHVFTPTFSHIFRTTEDPAFNEKISPLFHIDSIEKPLLIGQGANDPRVKQAEADQIAFAMKEKEIPVEYVLYPDEGHGFARPVNRIDFNARAEAFLAKYLGGRAEPAPAESESTAEFPLLTKK